MGAIRVAIVVDDHLLRDGLQQILRSDPSFFVIDHTDTALNREDVDIRVVDARGHDSIAEETILNEGRPHVVVVNVPDDDAWAAKALSAGIRGILAHTAGADDLLKAIRVVHDGGIWAGRTWLISCVARAAGAKDESFVAKPSPTVDKCLSRREWEVFRHAATGASNKELADRLAISEATVKVHMTRIFQKPGVNGRAELVAAFYGRTSESDPAIRRTA